MADVLVVAVENGEARRVVMSTDLQVGYPGKPSELHVTGKFSQSIAFVDVKPGQTVPYPDNVSTLLVRNSTPSGSSVVTVTLPPTPREGQTCHVKDSNGTASTNALVLDGGGKTIDGTTTRKLSNPYDSMTVVWNGTSWSILSYVSSSPAAATPYVPVTKTYDASPLGFVDGTGGFVDLDVGGVHSSGRYVDLGDITHVNIILSYETEFGSFGRATVLLPKAPTQSNFATVQDTVMNAVTYAYVPSGSTTLTLDTTNVNRYDKVVNITYWTT